MESARISLYSSRLMRLLYGYLRHGLECPQLWRRSASGQYLHCSRVRPLRSGRIKGRKVTQRLRQIPHVTLRVISVLSQGPTYGLWTGCSVLACGWVRTTRCPSFIIEAVDGQNLGTGRVIGARLSPVQSRDSEIQGRLPNGLSVRRIK
jgi:hypothetical protein